MQTEDRRLARQMIWLRITAWLAASASLGALLAHVFGLLDMAFFVTAIALPALALLFALAALGRFLSATVFLNALAVGLAGGLAATAAYDVSRAGLISLGLFHYDPFLAIHLFGSWIVHEPVGSRSAAIAGWTYHLWNGLSFGVMYTLTFGRRPWTWGLAYGVFMELCMLGLFPRFLHIVSPFDFAVLSLIGHGIYGIVLGLVAQRYGRRWSDAQ